MEFAKLFLKVWHCKKFEEEKKLMFEGYALGNKDFNIKDFKQFYAVRYKDVLLAVMARRHDGVLDWYVIRDGRCTIITQHTLLRFRKRVLSKTNPELSYNMRGITRNNFKDIWMLSSNLIIDINLFSIIVEGININDKYDDNCFMVTKYGLIPLDKLDENIYKSSTFISNDMLSDDQMVIYQKVVDKIKTDADFDQKGYGVTFYSDEP